MDKIIKNMFLYSSQRANLEKYQCKDFGINLLKVIQIYVEVNPAYFANCWKELIQFTILPLLVITEE